MNNLIIQTFCLRFFQAMIEAMKVMKWERIVVLYSDDDYGRAAMNEMMRRSQMENVCVVKLVALPKTQVIADFLEKMEDIGIYDINGGVVFADHETTDLVSLFLAHLFWRKSQAVVIARSLSS